MNGGAYRRASEAESGIAVMRTINLEFRGKPLQHVTKNDDD
jgi:hypothetical protein